MDIRRVRSRELDLVISGPKAVLDRLTGFRQFASSPSSTLILFSVAGFATDLGDTRNRCGPWMKTKKKTEKI